jgi:hypothetical protein
MVPVVDLLLKQSALTFETLLLLPDPDPWL